MGYRNESEALRAKLALKEAELAEANAKLEALQGPGAEQKSNAFLGAPTRLLHQQLFEGALTEERLEKIVRVLRQRSDNLGRMERLGDTVSWTSTPAGNAAHQPLEVILERRGESTHVSIRERLGQYAGGIFGGLLGGLGGGAMPGVVALTFALGLSPIAIPMVAVAWFGAVYLGARGIYKSIVTRHAKTNTGTLAAIAEVMRSEPAGGAQSSPRVRAANAEAPEEFHEVSEEADSTSDHTREA